MDNQNEIDLKSYFLRLIMVICVGFVITYFVLYFFLQFGNHGLFFGGAIVGGFWGNIWNMTLFVDKRLTKDSFPNSTIIFLTVCLIIILLSLIIVLPLPN